MAVVVGPLVDFSGFALNDALDELAAADPEKRSRGRTPMLQGSVDRRNG